MLGPLLDLFPCASGPNAVQFSPQLHGVLAPFCPAMVQICSVRVEHARCRWWGCARWEHVRMQGLPYRDPIHAPALRNLEHVQPVSVQWAYLGVMG